MLADISSGHTAGADVLFFVAVIVFALAAVATLVGRAAPFASFLLAVGLACTACAWLVL